MSNRTMNVSLTPELEGLVQSYVTSGMYASQSEVVRAALRALQSRDEEHAARLESLRSEIAEGARDVHEGRFAEVSLETIRLQSREARANG